VQVPRNWYKGWPKAGYHFPFELDGLQGKEGDYLTDRLTDEALHYIEENRDRPFFLYLSHFAVHDPIQGRADLVEKYGGKLAQLPPPSGDRYILEGDPGAENPLSRAELTKRLDEEAYRGYRLLPDRTVKIKQHQDNVRFAAMVESMDESLGRVLDKLEELDLDENTLVIFFSDNGGMAGANFGRPHRVIRDDQQDLAYSTSNLPLRGAKGWLYEGGIRVPLIVRWPELGRKGTVCEVPVVSTDFYPSILELAGLPSLPEQHVDGVSLAPLLRGETGLDRKAIYWHFPHYSNHGLQSPGGAVRVGDYKLLEYFENDTVQLFNLRDDIGEQNDLSKVQPDRVVEMRAVLRAWREEVSAPMMPPNPDYDPGIEPGSEF
jgi:arylsulfatase A-like enzyme